MVYPAAPHLFFELECRIRERSGWRVRNLLIEVDGEPSRAILRGRATTLTARRIAQEIVQDHFPHAFVENAILVDNEVEVLPGMPLN